LTTFDFYSIRQLNPFRGIVQIVRSSTARALSSDGIVWRLQIRSDLEHIPWGLVDNPNVLKAYHLYGIWTERDGLTRLPIHPVIDVDRANLEASTLIASLQNLPEMPFPLKDNIEFWLRDKNSGLPLSLIASICEQDPLPDSLDPHWLPSMPGENNLTIKRVDSNTLNNSSILTGKSAHEYLASIVMRQCNKPPQGYWIKRQADGSGLVYSNITNYPLPSPTVLAARYFPRHMLSIDQFIEQERPVLQQYIKWLAPYLLTLQTLDDETREQLEVDAFKRPMVLHIVHRTLPKVINRKLLNAALVEAELRKAAAQ